jgi:cytochrome c biogenesis protein CcmG, thiol:disulfide interchange protein DsbE
VGKPVRRSDRIFRIIAVVACAGLIAFVATVILSGSSPAPRKTFPDPPPPSIAAGKQAPAFELARLGGGPEVSLSEFLGKPVIVNFFASWCPDCQAELATIATAARAQTGHVDVVGVDTNDSDTSSASHLLQRAGARYPVGVDPLAKVASRYLIQALPITYFLNARGMVVGVAFGRLTSAELDSWMRRLRGGSGA